MAVPIYSNRKTAGVRSSRVSPGDKPLDFVTPELGRVEERVDALIGLKEKQAESEGASEYLKWNEAAATKAAELGDRNGTNAVGLPEEFDEWNDEYKNNLDFSGREAEKAFADRAGVSSSNYRKNLSVYQSAEIIEYNNQVKTAEITSGMGDALVALTSGDMLGYSWGKAKSRIAFDELHTGEPEESVDQQWKESNDKITNQLATTMVQGGQTEQAFSVMSQSNSMGDVTDLTYSSFKILNKGALAKSLGEKRVNTIINSDSNYTNEEWAIMNDIDLSTMPEEEKIMNSGYSKGLNQKVVDSESFLSDNDFEGSKFFEGDSDFNNMVNEQSSTRLAQIKSGALAAEKAAVDVITTDITDLIHKKGFVATPEDLAKIDADIDAQYQALRDKGEWKKMSELKDVEYKNIDPVPGEFERVSLMVMEDAVSPADVASSETLSWDEKQTLNSFYKDTRKKDMKDRFEALNEDLLMRMMNTDDIETLENEELLSYQAAYKQMVTLLSTRYSISELDAPKVEELIAESAKYGWSNIDIQAMKKIRKDRFRFIDIKNTNTIESSDFTKKLFGRD